MDKERQELLISYMETNYYLEGLELTLYRIFVFLIFLYIHINMNGIIIMTIRLVSATRLAHFLHSLDIPRLPLRFALSGQEASLDILCKFSNAGQETSTKYIT